MDDKNYFDARFDGLKELMVSQHANMTQHISAVSSNAKKTQSDLQEHKESTGAHGIEASGKSASAIASWLGLGLAAGLGVIEFFRGHK